MCLGACVLKREKFVCFACLFYMGFTRETTLWFFVPLIPLLFVLWRSFGRKAMGSIALLVTATAVPIGTLNFYHWYTLGTPVISLGQGHALSGAFQYFSEIDPNIVKETCFREILPNGGRLDWWTDCVQKMYHGVSGKMASDPAFREQLRYPENALNAAKAKIGKQIERDFFRVALTHPLVLLKTFQLQRMCTVLAEHDLAFGFLFKGFPAVCFFLGALLSIMGALWALRGLPSFFRKKSPLDNRELVAFCVFLHILGFNAANSIIVPSMNYLLHAAILSGFLGWWAIASYTKVYKERKGSPAG
jgi:hypothetical protein